MEKEKKQRRKVKSSVDASLPTELISANDLTVTTELVNNTTTNGSIDASVPTELTNTNESIEPFELTSPPTEAPIEEGRVRVNLWLPKSMHRELRKYGIDNGDLPLPETIQAILKEVLK